MEPASAPAAALETVARLQQGRLTFAATLYALQGKCPCQGCQLLRNAVNILLGDVYKEVTESGTGANNPPPTVPTVPNA